MEALGVMREVLEAPRRAFVRVPGMRVVERPGWWQIVTPLFRDGPLNEVAHSVLADADADAVIDATIAEYRGLGLRFRWMVDPTTRPADLGKRLAARGLEPSELVGLMVPTAATGGDDRVEEIDATGIDAFNDVMARGWELDRGPIDTYHRALLAEAPRRHHLFLARVDGVPAGVSGYCGLERSAYLFGGLVLPAFRGRGLYRAMVAARLDHAARAGLGIATIQARATTSAPILARLGFHTVCPLTAYRG